MGTSSCVECTLCMNTLENCKCKDEEIEDVKRYHEETMYGR